LTVGKKEKIRAAGGGGRGRGQKVAPPGKDERRKTKQWRGGKFRTHDSARKKAKASEDDVRGPRRKGAGVVFAGKNSGRSVKKRK